jgi:hypothetical protein
VIQPPSSGPTTGATSVVMAHIAIAKPASAAGSWPAAASATAGSSARPPGPAARGRRSAIRSMFGASPHSHEASTNSSTLAVNRRTWPKRCVSQPVSGTDGVGHRERGDDPGALRRADAHVARDRRDRHVGDRRVEHVHERGQRQRQRAGTVRCRPAAEGNARRRCRRRGRGGGAAAVRAGLLTCRTSRSAARARRRRGLAGRCAGARPRLAR